MIKYYDALFESIFSKYSSEMNILSEAEFIHSVSTTDDRTLIRKILDTLKKLWDELLKGLESMRKKAVAFISQFLRTKGQDLKNDPVKMDDKKEDEIPEEIKELMEREYTLHFSTRESRAKANEYFYSHKMPYELSQQEQEDFLDFCSKSKNPTDVYNYIASTSHSEEKYCKSWDRRIVKADTIATEWDKIYKTEIITIKIKDITPEMQKKIVDQIEQLREYEGKIVPDLEKKFQDMGTKYSDWIKSLQSKDLLKEAVNQLEHIGRIYLSGRAGLTPLRQPIDYLYDFTWIITCLERIKKYFDGKGGTDMHESALMRQLNKLNKDSHRTAVENLMLAEMVSMDRTDLFMNEDTNALDNIAGMSDTSIFSDSSDDFTYTIASDDYEPTGSIF